MKKETAHAERAHAVLSASGSEMWLKCPPSARLQEHLPEETSVYALEGTLAHEMAELMLKVDLRLIAMNQYRTEIEAFRKHELYKAEFEEPIMEYVTYVKQQYQEAKRIDPKAIILIEKKFSLEKYVRDGFGTSDNAIVFARQAEVIDLKFGAGKEVKAEHNTQLKYYALGVLESLGERAKDIDSVKLTIVQPRMNNISSWSIPTKFLIKWAEDVLRPGAVKAYAGEGEQTPGDWCQFCKVRPKCKALYNLAMDQVRRDFEEQDDPRLINDDEFVTLYQNADFIKKFLEDVKTVALKEALAGKQWPGLKLVAGKSNRVITDEQKVKQILLGELYENDDFLNVKLKGIGELETLLKKKGFEELLGHLVIKPTGAPTLVYENDKRELYGVAQIQKDFEVLPDDDEDDLN